MYLSSNISLSEHQSFHPPTNTPKQTIEDLVKADGREGPKDTCYLRFTSYNHVRTYTRDTSIQVYMTFEVLVIDIYTSTQIRNPKTGGPDRRHEPHLGRANVCRGAGDGQRPDVAEGGRLGAVRFCAVFPYVYTYIPFVLTDSLFPTIFFVFSNTCFGGFHLPGACRREGLDWAQQLSWDEAIHVDETVAAMHHYRYVCFVGGG